MKQLGEFFIRQATAVAIATVTLLMIFAMIIFYFQGRANDTSEGWVMHTYQVTGHLQLLFNRIKDVELGQRGYAITGDKAYLASYNDALKDSLGADAKSDRLEQHHSVAEELAILRKLSADNLRQQQNLDEMDNYLKELLQDWAAKIQTGPRPIKTIAPKSDFYSEDQLIDHIRSLFSIMMAEENRLLSLRIAADENNTLQNNILTFSGIAIFYGLMVLSILLYQNSRREAGIAREKLVEKLVQSNSELERFAYVASHDMQEPLRMIANFSDIIHQDYRGQLDDDGKEYIRIITEAALRMQNMVNDLLEYARIGSDDVRMLTIDSSLELKHVLENLTAVIQDRGAEITFDPLPNIHGNPVQFMRLLQNLIGNGLKYQRQAAKPQIHIGVADQGDNWCFSVRDNGIGMPEEFLTQVFQPYKRLHTWEEYKGTGIGLAVCKKIVENHGGMIWVVSKLGKGSTVYFTLPKIKLGESA